MSQKIDDDLAELGTAGAGAGVLLPWMAFFAALFAAIALFFVHAPR